MTTSKNINKEFKDLAKLFVGSEKDPMPYQEYLEESSLDYSLDSLKLIESYLSKVSVRIKKKQISNEDWVKLVVRTGAYLGEVIKNNDKKNKWEWIDYDTAVLNNEDFIDFGGEIGVAGILNYKDLYLMPVSKVEKFVIFGKSESLVKFAAKSLK